MFPGFSTRPVAPWLLIHIGTYTQACKRFRFGLHVHGAGYRKRTGQSERQRWQEARLQEQPALQRWQAGIPSARVAYAADHTRRIQYLYGGSGGIGLWQLLRHYRQWGQRRWRLTVYIRSQKVRVGC